MEQDILLSKINRVNEELQDNKKASQLKKLQRKHKKQVMAVFKGPTRKEIKRIKLLRENSEPTICVPVVSSYRYWDLSEEALTMLRELQKENIFFRESEIVNKIIHEKRINDEDYKVLSEKIRCASKNVFVVYGHNKDLNDKVCQTLSDNGYNPLTLDKRTIIGGETILDAIIDQAKECLTAVAICSADDFVQVKEEGQEFEEYKQPRPNVFFEIGYLYHCYAMTRVLIIKTQKAKMCSDLNGVRYILDKNLNQLINSLNLLTNIRI